MNAKELNECAMDRVSEMFATADFLETVFREADIPDHLGNALYLISHCLRLGAEELDKLTWTPAEAKEDVAREQAIFSKDTAYGRMLEEEKQRRKSGATGVLIANKQ